MFGETSKLKTFELLGNEVELCSSKDLYDLASAICSERESPEAVNSKALRSCRQMGPQQCTVHRHAVASDISSGVGFGVPSHAGFARAELLFQPSHTRNAVAGRRFLLNSNSFSCK